MQHKILYLLLSLLPWSSALAQNNQIDTTGSAAVLQVLSNQVAAWNKGDINNFMRTYWNSPDLVFVSGTTVTKGWEPTLARYKRVYDSRAKMGTLQFTNLKVSALAGDSATVLGNWALTRANDHPNGEFILKFRKINDQWFIVRDQTKQY
ncbi:nuclear transport factor 2 family protein [Adhaeribacter swui]|uniref:Nuclear transport factor 2 family protein n=1 Tax=Adhaeribacter swui TaxID=2086471 RepID=A0A7G7G6D5_9BACT|nr:nuclear transport factor 2 family protein [Adhaeribacter swui]QNF32719.1 nuclear transport factor 2 family protein [Adhaeribacter swui]